MSPGNSSPSSDSWVEDRSGVSSDRRTNYRPAAGEIPTVPGVYRFSDKHSRVLYIGKAKNLRARLSNYFGPLHALNPRIQRMLQLAYKVDWTVVRTDTEALVLEHTWINEFEPPFNVQFRDDKSYPYFAVTLGSEAPRLIVTRNQNIRGAKYFGPFPKLWAVRETASLLQRAFPIRTCNDADYKRAMSSGVPCLASQIGRCFGPCSHSISVEEHRKHVRELVSFLSGHDDAEIRRLRSQMQEAAARQDYELAAKSRDQIAAAQHILERNDVVLSGNVNADVYGIASDELAAAVHQFVIRGGRIRGERSWIVDVQLNESSDSLMSTLLQDVYLEQSAAYTSSTDFAGDKHSDAIPTLILVSKLPDEMTLLTGLLSERRKAQVSIQVPARGEKVQLVERAQANARENLLRYKLKRANDIVTRTDGLAELQAGLGMDEVPLRIECVDVSHLSGTNVVASLVVFEDGLPAKSSYRHYRIDHTTDDTDSIYQVVHRRFSRLLEEAQDTDDAKRQRTWPQLLIVDGGQPQVAAASRALTELGVSTVALCGVAKRLEEIWLPNENYPIILPRASEALFLIQRARDEAHRFAITFQRNRRSKGISTSLGDIPGLGEKRVQSLLKTFNSMKRIREASADEIASVPGIGAALAQQIYAHLHPRN